MIRSIGTAAVVTCLMAGAGFSQTCGGEYRVQRGDTLSAIADTLYKDAGKWTAIHTNNLSAIGQNPNSILVGQRLTLSCINGLPTGLPGGALVEATQEPVTEEEPVAVTRTETDLLGTPQLPRVKLVTGDDFAPFTDRSLENGGLLAEVVSSAMTAAVGDDGFDTFWINDWGSHLNAMMPAGVMEMAFPWARPPCEADPSNERCANFHFSEPMFEYLVLLFVHKDRPIPFATDTDIEGRAICRPNGYLTHMMDQDGRNWVSGNKITLVQPDKVSDCFDLLTKGEVDGVILNEFTARDAIHSMGLQDQIEAVQSRPVSITGLHVLVHKAHPNADQLLDTINTGLGAIKDDGTYQQIVSRHMETIWAKY